MQLDTGNRFQAFDMTGEEERLARVVSPLLHAYIQNKISVYANQVVDIIPSNFANREDYMLALEILKGQVRVLEELLSELAIPSIEDQEAPQG